MRVNDKPNVTLEEGTGTKQQRVGAMIGPNKL